MILFVRSHLTKDMFPYTKRVSCFRQPYVLDYKPQNNDFSRSRFLKGLEFGMEEFLFSVSLLLSTRCVCFFCVCAFSLLSFVVVCMSFCFLPRVCLCLVYSYCFFYIYWSVFCF